MSNRPNVDEFLRKFNKSFYYYYHPESDSVWKQIHPFTNQSNEDIFQLSQQEYFQKLSELHLQDGDDLISK